MSLSDQALRPLRARSEHQRRWHEHRRVGGGFTRRVSRARMPARPVACVRDSAGEGLRGPMFSIRRSSQIEAPPLACWRGALRAAGVEAWGTRGSRPPPGRLAAKGHMQKKGCRPSGCKETSAQPELLQGAISPVAQCCCKGLSSKLL